MEARRFCNSSSIAASSSNLSPTSSLSCSRQRLRATRPCDVGLGPHVALVRAGLVAGMGQPVAVRRKAATDQGEVIGEAILALAGLAPSR